MRYIRTLTGIVCIVSVICLCGCSSWYDYNSANNYGSRRDPRPQDTSRAYQTQQQYTSVSHKHSSLDMNQLLSDEIAAMDGVNTAIVMLADNTAYVGIMLDNSASGTAGYSRATNNYGTVRGMYDTRTPFSDYADPRNLDTGANNYATVPHHEMISHLLKQKVAEKIRALQPTVSDVYISANGQYINVLNRLAQESWKGQDLKPYIADFDAVSEHIFGTQPTLPTQSER
jgi:YhcN/YlaJ family sporulation lipoprotein